MEFYYYYAIVLTALAFVVKRGLLVGVILIGGCCFLLMLPSTGFDYDYYKEAYDNSYFDTQYPWFKTNAELTAEPLYKWYTSLISVLTPMSFQGFLALNFILCILISAFSFRGLKFVDLDLFWLAFVPVIFPTLFYFSPRSSISFFFVFAGFMSLVNKRVVVALVLIALGVSIHSQYILVSAFFVSSYIAYNFTVGMSEKIRKRAGVIILLLLGGVLIFVRYFMGVFASVLGALPSAEVAVSKLHYFDSAQSGYRITSVLSIVVYPAIYFAAMKIKNRKNMHFFNDEKKDNIFWHMLGLVILFGALVNIVFFETSHVAGRLSRFSDYMAMGLLVPVFLKLLAKREGAVLALWGFVWMAPVVYGTVYGI